VLSRDEAGDVLLLYKSLGYNPTEGGVENLGSEWIDGLGQCYESYGSL